jgi:glycosyltransferase involved in cell wall biosynthesis
MRVRHGRGVSVVICTHNRASWLEHTIRGVLQQRDACDAEILVVDNGSTDHTPEVVAGFPAVRYLREARLGLSRARNLGWREAEAPVVAYLDDDAVPEHGWLAAVEDTFSTDPRLGCAGGPVVPEWDLPSPPWLSDDVALALSIVDWNGATRRPLDLNTEWLAGANMACRVAALEAVNGFHPLLDRRGQRLLSSGDVFLQKQLIHRGYSCVYEPSMRVRHHIPASRLTRGWFRRRYFWQGVSDALMDIIEHAPSKTQRGLEAFRRSRALIAHPRRMAGLLRQSEDATVFEEQCWQWISLGHIAGLLGLGGA